MKIWAILVNRDVLLFLDGALDDLLPAVETVCSVILEEVCLPSEVDLSRRREALRMGMASVDVAVVDDGSLSFSFSFPAADDSEGGFTDVMVGGPLVPVEGVSDALEDAARRVCWSPEEGSSALLFSDEVTGGASEVVAGGSGAA